MRLLPVAALVLALSSSAAGTKPWARERTPTIQERHDAYTFGRPRWERVLDRILPSRALRHEVHGIISAGEMRVGNLGADRAATAREVRQKIDALPRGRTVPIPPNRLGLK